MKKTLIASIALGTMLMGVSIPTFAAGPTPQTTVQSKGTPTARGNESARTGIWWGRGWGWRPGWRGGGCGWNRCGGWDDWNPGWGWNRWNNWW